MNHRVRGLYIEQLEGRYPLDASSLSPIWDLSSLGITTTKSDTPVYLPGWEVSAGQLKPSTVESSSLINLDDFRADPRFAGIDGSGFSTVIIDSGIDLNHPFFGPDADFNGVADRIVFSYDFSGFNDPDASDFDGHGSNVASIVGSSDSAIGGMAPGTGIIALKVFDDFGSGTFGEVEEALQWVVANAAAYNIASVNMSLGDTGNYTSSTQLYGIGDELAALAAMNVIVVSAAGNDFGFFQAPGVSYPAADPNSLAVGAVWDGNNGGPYFWGGAADFTTGADRIVSFSQRSVTMSEIFAPGAMIAGAGRAGEIVYFAGTSQATPHITGIATLAQDLAEQVLGRRLTVAEFTSLLTDSASVIIDGDDEDDNVPNTLQSYRRVDALALGEAIIALHVPGIDVAATAFTVSPSNLLTASGVVSTSTTLRNFGDTDAEAFNVRFYLSNDETIDPLTDLPLSLTVDDPHYNLLDPGAYRVVGGLASQSAHAMTLSLQVPVDNPFSTDSRHYIGVFVDADAEVDEANEDNNRNRGNGFDLDAIAYGVTIAAFPFVEDWESGGFDAWWEVIPGAEGRIQISADNGPFSGNYHVVLDDLADDSQYSLNQLILHVDLQGEEGVLLEFANREFGDEDDLSDSVDVSVDGGNTWHQIVPLVGSNSTETYQERSYLLDNLGLVYSSDTLIRFQQYDNYQVPTDGMAFDNIRLSSIYGTIEGQKWNDLNGNGLRDPDDHGLEGWRIFIDDNLDGQWITDAVVEPDFFDAGALLNTAVAGVTFTAVGGSSTDVYAGPPMGGYASTGTLGFTRNGPFGWGQATRLRIDFDLPMSSVSLDAIADDPFDYAVLEAYDASGNLLNYYFTSGLSQGGVETMTVAFSTSEIAYVIASGWGGEVVNLDNLQYQHTDRSTTTDADGNYSFENLNPGEYWIFEVPQPGWQQTAPFFGGHYLFVGANQVVSGMDFGNFALPGSIQGRKWSDLDGDGIMDPDEPGLPGWTVYIDKNGNGILESDLTTVVSTDVPKGISDHSWTVSQIEVTGLQSIRDLNLTLNITHTYDADLLAYLISPSGTRIELFAGVGESGNNFQDTTFDDEALQSIFGGTAPFAGSYMPSQSLSIFDRQDPNGLWTLEIYDQFGGDFGTLNSWSLTLETGEDFVVTDSNGYYFIDVRPGEYEVREVPQAGWVQSPIRSIERTLGNLNANHADISALVPGRFNFSEGHTGNTIFDGGNDMFDAGNFLNTNLASGIAYTSGTIAQDLNAFGPGSKYFTAKYDGLFVMGATDIDITSFSLSGNNGADGFGFADGARLTTTVNGQQYTIFVKRVYGASDPSINQIIMVPGDGAGISHTFPSNTDNGGQSLTGLTGVKEIYYALVARELGGYLANNDVLAIANEFLSNIAQSDSHLVTIGPGENVVDVNFGNRPLPGGIQGQKWNDLNHNGVKDAGEPGLAGWTIYIDENFNGQFDAVASGVEPDNYLPGTDLESVVPGVTLSVDGTSLPAVIATTGLSSTGSQVFASSTGGAAWSQVTRLRADFDTPTSFVSIDAISDDAFDIGRLEAYSSDGTLLESYTTPGLSTGQIGVMTISRTTADIAYIVAYGPSGQALNLDNLVFQTFEAHTVTDSEGNYAFADLPIGPYLLRALPQSGWIQTFPFEMISGSAVFDDPFFVDSSNSVASESDNIQAGLGLLGLPFHTFTGTDAASWLSAMVGTGSIIIPELELNGLAGFLSSAAMQAIRDYVQAGGGLIINGTPNGNAGALLNQVFGWSLNEQFSGFASYTKTPAAAGTEFGDDAASLPGNDATAHLPISSLPPGALTLYETFGQAAVALVPYGLGNVIYLGFDWFNAVPVGSQDGGWLQALESAVRQTAQFGIGAHYVVVDAGQIDVDVNFGSYASAPVLSADFDGDGDVDGRDFLAWQRGYGTVAATKEQGDANADGLVNGSDLSAWQDTYGQTAIVGFVVSAEVESTSTSSSGTAGWFAFRRSLEIVGDSVLQREDQTRFAPVDDAFSTLSEPTSWQGSDFGDIAVCRDSDEEFEFDTEFDELLLAAFSE